MLLIGSVVASLHIKNTLLDNNVNKVINEQPNLISKFISSVLDEQGNNQKNDKPIIDTTQVKTSKVNIENQ